MLTTDKIRTLLEEDMSSQLKQDARTGQRYYEGRHDIEKRRIFFVDNDGNWVEDKLKSNIRISHPFHRELTDQAVQYLLSGDGGYIRSDDPDLQSHLDARFNENESFTAELYKMLTGVVAKGWDYMYGYKDENNRTCFQHADCLNVSEVREAGREYLIYSYGETVGDKTLRRIQVWDDQQVWYYCQTDGGEIKPDDSEQVNPRPHTLYVKGETAYRHREQARRIPFFRMDNFPDRRSDLFLYKDKIDDYDLMNCGLSNAIEDTAEAYYAVSGYDGEDIDELITNLKAKRAIGVGEGGSVKIQTVDVPVEARRAKMEIDKENIYHFGQGLNLEGLRDTAATTNIAIKSAYTQLNFKAVKLRIALKQFLRKILEAVLPEISRETGKEYGQKDVYFVFQPKVPMNELENAQIALANAQKRQTEIKTILDMEQRLGRELTMQLVFEQLDMEYGEYKDILPREDLLKNRKETTKDDGLENETDLP